MIKAVERFVSKNHLGGDIMTKNSSTSIITSTVPSNPHVLVLTINRPPANAISQSTYIEVTTILSSLRGRKDIRCVVLTGQGEKFFSAGSDVNELGELNPNSARERSHYARGAFESIRNCVVPVVAAVNGYALGSGLVMSMLCDIVVASEHAKFGLPEINAGVMGGTKHLARVVPEKVMRLMALTGRMLEATELQKFGAVNYVCPKDRLMETALAIANEIASKSPAAVGLMKEVMNLTESMDIATGYHVETYATAIITSHPHSKEAANAFKERRPPNFQE